MIMFNLKKKFIAQYSRLTTRYSIRQNKPVIRWTLMLPGAGCEYRKKNHNGCVMCGFDQSVRKIHHGILLPSFCFKFLYWLSEKDLLVENIKPEEIYIYNGGSFFNQNEIPIQFQRYFFDKISTNPDINRIVVESRCDYINIENISQAVSTIGNKKLTIAIGLESANDKIRNKVLKKGLSKKVFEKTIQNVNECGANVLAYIFLKPIGLSDNESFNDLTRTIKYALSIGVTEIEISCAFIQSNTKLSKAYLCGQYKPPTLWTILKIIDYITTNQLPVSIGGFSDEPPPIAIPANCPDCSPIIYEAIEQFRQQRKLGIIPKCQCKI